MANHFPYMPQMQLSSLGYTVTVGGVSGPSATFPAGQLDLLNISFATVADDGTLTFDYSGFDQDAHETQLSNLLTSLCTVMAGNVGVTLDAAQAAMTVSRRWVFMSPTQVGYTFSTCESSDQMPYP